MIIFPVMENRNHLPRHAIVAELDQQVIRIADTELGWVGAKGGHIFERNMKVAPQAEFQRAVHPVPQFIQ